MPTLPPTHGDCLRSEMPVRFVPVQCFANPIPETYRRPIHLDEIESLDSVQDLPLRLMETVHPPD